MVLLTDEDDAVVPEVGGSLPSVTWNDDLMDVFDVSGVDQVDGMSTFTNDLSQNHLPPQSNVRQKWLQYFENSSYYFLFIYHTFCDVQTLLIFNQLYC